MHGSAKLCKINKQIWTNIYLRSVIKKIDKKKDICMLLQSSDIGKFLEFPVHMHVLKMTEELDD